MADEFYRKQEIFMRHGKGYRQYPFSMVELVNPSTGVVLGSGMMPDGDSVLQYAPPNEEIGGLAQDTLENLVDPPFIYNNTLATGVLVSRFV